jgi:hypothetical protein
MIYYLKKKFRENADKGILGSKVGRLSFESSLSVFDVDSIIG